MQPSEVYRPIMEAVAGKIYLSKIVIEFIQNHPEATYEDLLYKIQTVVPPQGVTSINEEAVLRHSQWIVDQVRLSFHTVFVSVH